MMTKDEIIAGYVGMDYKQSVEHQLTHWVSGTPTHNPIGAECCPDFSCCNPQSLLPQGARLKFQEAHISGNSELRSQMLMMCLGGLIGDKAHIVGDTPETTH